MHVSEGVEADARKAKLVQGKEALRKCNSLFSRQKSIIAAQKTRPSPAPVSPCAIAPELSESGLALTLDSWDNHAKSLTPSRLSWQQV